MASGALSARVRPLRAAKPRPPRSARPDRTSRPDFAGTTSRPGLSFEDLVELKTAGLPRGYIEELSDLFPEITLDQLLECHEGGMEADYAASMAPFFGELDVAPLLELHESGVEPDYAGAMMSVFGPLDAAQLVELHEAGVGRLRGGSSGRVPRPRARDHNRGGRRRSGGRGCRVFRDETVAGRKARAARRGPGPSGPR